MTSRTPFDALMLPSQQKFKRDSSSSSRRSTTKGDCCPPSPPPRTRNLPLSARTSRSPRRGRGSSVSSNTGNGVGGIKRVSLDSSPTTTTGCLLVSSPTIITDSASASPNTSLVNSATSTPRLSYSSLSLSSRSSLSHSSSSTSASLPPSASPSNSDFWKSYRSTADDEESSDLSSQNCDSPLPVISASIMQTEQVVGQQEELCPALSAMHVGEVQVADMDEEVIFSTTGYNSLNSSWNGSHYKVGVKRRPSTSISAVSAPVSPIIKRPPHRRERKSDRLTAAKTESHDSSCEDSSVNSEMELALAEYIPKLPCIEKCASTGRRRCISPETLVRAIRGEYNNLFSKCVILDCRFGYEYNGGKIKGALNVPFIDTVDTFFATETPSDMTLYVFHCEFSSCRAPEAYARIRGADRKRNMNIYPRLDFPEMYILEGGYKAFFEQFADLCDPRAYIPMRDEDHRDELKIALKASSDAIRDQKTYQTPTNSAARRSLSAGTLFGDPAPEPKAKKRQVLIESQ